MIEGTRLLDYLDTNEKAIHGRIEFKVSYWDNDYMITARDISESQNVIERCTLLAEHLTFAMVRQKRDNERQLE